VPAPTEVEHVGRLFVPFDDRGNVRPPCAERRALLLRPLMALIDADNSGAAAGYVVENCVGDFKPNA
jgi:hypothetical protein